MIFGIYALAVLAALLVVGRLSDHIGRRPVLLAATVVQAATMLLFAHASGLSDLIIARIIQGLSAGAAVAAVGAGLLDIDRTRGTTANAVTPPLGTATGGLVGGLMVQFLPAPTHLVYYVLAAVFVLQGVGVYFMGRRSLRAAAYSPSQAAAQCSRKCSWAAVVRASRARWRRGRLLVLRSARAIDHAQRIGIHVVAARRTRALRAGR